MKMSGAANKVFLRELFLEEQQGRLVEKKFPLDKLEDVISISKKLLDGTTPDSDNPNVIKFSDKEIEFTPAETAILVELFDAVKEFPIGKAEVALEISKLLKGKK